MTKKPQAMSIKKAFLKGVNWALAAIITLLGFAGCDKIGVEEYGTPHADYTVKGVVVDKTTQKPVTGIRVGYSPDSWPMLMYGVLPTPYQPKKHVLTNDKGEFILKDDFSIGQILMIDNVPTLPVYIEDIDGEKNGLFERQYVEVDFSKASLGGKQNSWYTGEYVVNQNIELTPVENQ